jgi:hypothetical protein
MTKGGDNDNGTPGRPKGNLNFNPNKGAKLNGLRFSKGIPRKYSKIISFTLTREKIKKEIQNP